MAGRAALFAGLCLLLLALGAQAYDFRVCANRGPKWFIIPIVGSKITKPVPNETWAATIKWVTNDLKKKKKLGAGCKVYVNSTLQTPSPVEACFEALPKTQRKQWWGEIDFRYYVDYKCPGTKKIKNLQVEAYVKTRNGGKIKSVTYDYQTLPLTG